MDFETVTLIKSKPDLESMKVCRNCDITEKDGFGRLKIDMETLREVTMLKLTHSCIECEED